jgi:hypothetical protein
MHIEERVVTGAGLLVGCANAAGAGLHTAGLAGEALRGRGPVSPAARSALATAAVFTFFELLPLHPVGLSEVHVILGATLFLRRGAAPAAVGLALGLPVQGMFFAPFDLPQYGMNVAKLLLPLFALQALAPSTAYQGGAGARVAAWAFLGQGSDAVTSVLAFGAAYMLVVLIEPRVDLAVRAGAMSLRGPKGSGLVPPRLHAAAWVRPQEGRAGRLGPRSHARCAI